MHEKEGAGSEDWTYIRDGTSLSELLKKELGVQVAADGSDGSDGTPV